MSRADDKEPISKVQLDDENKHCHRCCTGYEPPSLEIHYAQRSHLQGDDLIE